MKQHKIIIAEDEKSIAGLIRSQLESQGYTVPAIVQSGEEAVKSADAMRPDLVIMDIRLKGQMDGITAAQKIHTKKDIPVIYLTAYVDDDLRKRARSTDPYGFILKPYKAQELYSAIEMALYKHAHEKKIERAKSLAQKKVEKAFHDLYANMKEGVCLYELLYDERGEAVDYRILDVNPSWESLTGIKREEAVGSKASDLYHIAELPFLDVYANVANTGQPDSFESYIPHADKHFHISVFSSVRGQFCTILDDITGRKKLELDLIESEKRYRSLFQDSMDAIYINLLDGTFLDVNDAMCKLLGYSREELLSLSALQTYKDPSDREDYIKQIDKNGFIKEYELQLRKKDGSIIDVIITANTWSLPDGRIGGYRGFIRDITERKRMEIERKNYNEALLNSMLAAVESIAAMTELRDPYTAGHQKRVAQLAVAISRELGLPDHKIEGIRLASLIHDIGKLAIPAEILAKPGALSDLEYGMIKKHAEIASTILRPIKFPWSIADMIVKHHERLDGSGYPAGLKGDEICMEAKIIAVADVVEAMSSHRPYRAAKGIDQALDEITRQKGILYDPHVVDACVRLFKEKGFKFE